MSEPGVEGSRFSSEFYDRVYQVALYGSAAIVFFVGIFPIYWMAQNGFKSTEAILEGVSLYPTPQSFTLQNFQVLGSGDLLTYVINTLIVTVGTVVASVVISMITGYGLARFQFKYKKSFARFLLFGYMFSPIVLGLPLYLIWDSLGLVNTYIGIIIAITATAMPFCVWLMWKYIQTIPESMEHSAWIAGASRWRGFRDIIVPQTRPAIVATALFSFALAWTDFTFAQILLPANEKTTFAPGVMRLIYQSTYVDWGELMAVSLLMTLPPLAFAYFLQGYLLRGFKVRAE